MAPPRKPNTLSGDGPVSVTASNYDQVVAGIIAKGGLSGSRAPAGTVFEDGSIAGGGVLPGSAADIGDSGYGIDVDTGTIIW